MTSEIKKRFILGVLLIFPIVVYLFFASGKNNFAKLPVLSKDVLELDIFKSFEKRKVLLKHWDQSYKLATRSVKTFDILKARNVKIGVSGWNSRRIAKSIKKGYEKTKKSYLNKAVTAIHSKVSNLFTGSGKTK